MKKNKLPEDLEPSCELCEYVSRINITGNMFCKYKNSMKKVDENHVCKKFSFDIFAYKPRVQKKPKAFDFTKI